MLRIFVEGRDDKNFIRAYIKHLFSDHFFVERENDAVTEGIVALESKKTLIEIVNSGGWQSLSRLQNKFRETIDYHGKNFVIFDSDYTKNGGGYENRKEQLEKLKPLLDIEFDLFLIPNNLDDGDLEILLEAITKPEHKHIFECFEKYEKCLEKIKDSEGKNKYELPLRKSKIDAYLEAFCKNKKQRKLLKNGERFLNNPEYWDLDNEILQSLKNFLENYLK